MTINKSEGQSLSVENERSSHGHCISHVPVSENHPFRSFSQLTRKQKISFNAVRTESFLIVNNKYLELASFHTGGKFSRSKIFRAKRNENRLL